MDKGKTILCTSATPHGFKAKKVCGQLYSLDQNSGLPLSLCGIALKVMSTPSTHEFTFVSPNKTLTPAVMTEVSAQLASGQLQVLFGYVLWSHALAVHFARAIIYPRTSVTHCIPTLALPHLSYTFTCRSTARQLTPHACVLFASTWSITWL